MQVVYHNDSNPQSSLNASKGRAHSRGALCLHKHENWLIPIEILGSDKSQLPLTRKLDQMSNKRSSAAVSDKYLFSEMEEKLDKDNMDRVVKKYIDASQANSTKRAYASDLRHFIAHGGCVPCTPKRLAKYLAKSANDGLKIATLERRLTAIHKAHEAQKLPSSARSEIVRQVMQGIRRTLGAKQRQVKPLMKDDLLTALTAIERHQRPIKAARDQALLLIGFASAMRRSELVAVRIEHLTHLVNGMEIFLPTSKTDQASQGRSVFIPSADSERCPVRALRNWLKVSEITEGFVFRAVSRHDRVARVGLSAQSVALVIKASVERVGGDSTKFSGHSLRAGYCSSAAEKGLQPWQIREQTGHKSEVTLAKYIRPINRRKLPSLL